MGEGEGWKVGEEVGKEGRESGEMGFLLHCGWRGGQRSHRRVKGCLDLANGSALINYDRKIIKEFQMVDSVLIISIIDIISYIFYVIIFNYY